MGIGHQQRLYGQLLVDFANSDSTDKAGLMYFENVKKVFGFTDQFVIQAKDKFPTLEIFNALLKNDSEKRCFDLILKKADAEIEIQSSISANFLEYNVHSKLFHILEMEKSFLEEDLRMSCDKYTNKPITVTKLRELILSSHVNPSFKLGQEDFSKLISKLEIVAEQIRALKDISEDRYKELSELLPDYRDMMFEHGFIEKWQSNLHTLLDQMVKEGSINQSSILDEIIDKYNAIPRSSVYVAPEGLIKEAQPFNEDLILNPRDAKENLLIYDGPISYCVIQFFKDDKNLNTINQLKRCNDCYLFFISSKNNPRQKYCPDCSMKNHTSPEVQAERTRVSRAAEKKRLDRERDRQLFELQRDRLLQAGFSEKEAKLQAEAYVIEQRSVIE